jgi:cytochrome P450 family 6
MALLTALALLFALIFLLYRWIKNRFAFFEINKFAYVKPSFPFGNLKGAGSEFHANELFEKLYNELKGKGPASGVFFFLKPNIMITDLDVIKDVLIRNFDNFRNRGLYYNEKDDPLSANLFTVEDYEWKHMRTKMTPTFTSGRMKMMFNIIADIADNMVEELNASSSLEMVEARDIFVKYTVDVIGNVAFGLDLNAIKDKDSQFHQMAMKVFKPSATFFLKSFFLISFKSIGHALRMRFFPQDVSDFFMTTIRETVEYRLKNNIERNDFMNMLLKMYKAEEGSDEKLTPDQLASQCFLFFVAGFETSSSTASFVLYNLALHDDVQERLREDVKKAIARHGEKVSYEAVGEMKYLQMVIDGEFDRERLDFT